MPSEGLDEHLQSTIYLLNYYRDVREDREFCNEVAALPSAPENIIAEFAGYTPRPNLVVRE